MLEVSTVLLQAQFNIIVHIPRHASQYCRGGIVYWLRNCLLEVIQHAETAVMGSFLQVNPQEKNLAWLSWERGRQMFFEMKRSLKRPLSMFVVALTVWRVAGSCWNQQSRSSISNKATNFNTRSLYTAPDSAFK